MMIYLDTVEFLVEAFSGCAALTRTAQALWLAAGSEHAAALV